MLFSARSSRRRRDRRPQWSLAALEPRLMLAGDVANAASTPSTSDVPAETAGEVAIHTTVQSDIVVFVDSAVSELTDVAQPIAEGAELVLLNGDVDGIAQIRSHLQQRSGIRALHILSHGSAGELQLGTARLSAETLGKHVDNIRGWGDALAPGADLLIYGCEVAADDSGMKLVSEIARLSGADVAASIDRTANARHGGDWDLEYQVGAIESDLALSNRAMDSFGGHLAIQISAAGSTGDEEMQLLVNDQVVATWNVTGDGAYSGQFDTYTANLDGIDVDQIKVRFTNDLYIPEQGIDRNLRVDWIRVDGVQHETEAPNVFSTGTWVQGVGIQPGFWETEYLHTNGSFQYADDGGTVNNGAISVASAQISVDEGSSVATIVLQRTGGSDGVAEVFYDTSGLSATEGSDYVGARSIVAFFSLTAKLPPRSIFRSSTTVSTRAMKTFRSY